MATIRGTYARLFVSNRTKMNWVVTAASWHSECIFESERSTHVLCCYRLELNNPVSWICIIKTVTSPQIIRAGLAPCSGGACFPPRWCELLVGRPLTVTSLGLVSPGAATDCVTLFFSLKIWRPFFPVIALWKVMTFFSCRLLTTPIFARRLSSVLSKLSRKKN